MWIKLLKSPDLVFIFTLDAEEAVKCLESNHCVKSVRIRSFFWSIFSRIRTEFGEIRSISPYSVRMRENTDQKKSRIWTLFTQWMTCRSAFRPWQTSLMSYFMKMVISWKQLFNRITTRIEYLIPAFAKLLPHFLA